MKELTPTTARNTATTMTISGLSSAHPMSLRTMGASRSSRTSLCLSAFVRFRLLFWSRLGLQRRSHFRLCDAVGRLRLWSRLEIHDRGFEFHRPGQEDALSRLEGLFGQQALF